MRLLVVANIVPYPPHGGVHQRIFHLLERVANRHDVTLACHAWCDEDRRNAEWLTRNGIRTVTAPLRPANWRHTVPALCGALGAGQPPEVVQYQTPELHALIARERFDLVQVEETILAPYAWSLPHDAKTKTLLTFHNVHFVQAMRIAQVEKNLPLRLWRSTNAAMMRRYEPAIAARFDRSITVSEVDRDLLLGEAPDLRIDVLANGVDTSRPLLPEPPSDGAIVFVGTLNYRPCIDAVEWLVSEILPILRARRPDLALWIVGKNPTAEVQALAGKGVYVTGEVEAVEPYYRRAAVAVVPLRAGGGSRLKILEAMALGRPVVSTTIGAEGLALTDGQDILLADDPQAFAAAVDRLMCERQAWRSLVGNGRRFVEQRHSWDALAETQLAIYDEVLADAA